ncbi:MAG: hypothetical protein WCD54_28015, partial [Pseudolabrys sp.]
MQTDSFLNQPRAREMGVAPLRSGTWTGQAPINARRPPFDGLTIGLHWGTVLLVLVLFASAWLHALAETQQSHFTPQDEPAALPQTSKQAASRYGQID